MKKSLLAFALLALTSLIAQAQVTLITRVGASLATIQPNTERPGYQYTSGWLGGMGLNLPLTQSQVISLQPEVLFLQKGFGMADNRYIHNYLELPLLIKVNLTRNALQSYLVAGPTGGFLLGALYPSGAATGQVRQNDLAVQMNETLNTEDHPATVFNRLEFGLQVGAGAGLRLGRGTALVDFRFGQGLTPFFRTGGAVGVTRFTNRAFGLTLGYALPLAGKS